KQSATSSGMLESISSLSPIFFSFPRRISTLDFFMAVDLLRKEQAPSEGHAEQRLCSFLLARTRCMAAGRHPLTSHSTHRRVNHPSIAGQWIACDWLLGVPASLSVSWELPVVVMYTD